MLLETLGNARGAFVMWNRSGHLVQQENKTAVLDLLDALAWPSEEYFGSLGERHQTQVELIRGDGGGVLSEKDKLSILRSVPSPVKNLLDGDASNPNLEVNAITSKLEVMFQLNPPPKRLVERGITTSREAKSSDIAENTEADDQSGLPGSSNIAETGPSVETEEEVKAVSPARTKKTANKSPVKFRLGSEIEPEPVVMSGALPHPSLPTDSSRPAISTQPTDYTHSSVSGASAIPSDTNNANISTMNNDIETKSSDNRTLSNVISISAPAFIDSEMAPLVMSLVSSVNDLSPSISTEQQRLNKRWTDVVLPSKEAMSLDEELALRQKEFTDLESQIRDRRASEAAARLTRLEEEQNNRRKLYEDEDNMLLEKVIWKSNTPLILTPLILTQVTIILF